MCRDLGGKQSRPEGEARAEALRVESAGVSGGLSTAVFLKLEPTSEDTWRATAGSQPQGRRLASRIPMGGNSHVRTQRSVSLDMSIGYCGTLRWGRPRGGGHTTVALSILLWRQRTDRETKDTWAGNRERLLIRDGGRF